ncbi:MAG TPA: helix-hairpin-helix domain-containing protein [Spirochaetota bacterium]|nr:helix-hairpin-helix domain-containing protein [Spirochaetota bacterium]HPC41395.1 helix-hairpin-helix domain-containing protein [Spirochaetota bacterium]HQF09223.1 helix-hairpin-helix domain-containing protein [Spirochaetota bacterium]HQH97764.1 helix-hairpin-helix domain-containing protein [Spirochaetota bacterium]HQJ71467.1 helix-hairpin-helix domain-containing protein [Spirochaetota bacterium]
MKKREHGSNLQEIPGVGPSIEKDLLDIGISRVEDLKGKRPDELYDKLCRLRNTKIDRCVLYVFRCAVYYAGSGNHDPDLLKWWNWKDR